MTILHITNGDSVVEKFERIGLAGQYLPWRDVLHDGPVLAGEDLTYVSRQRARFIASCGWGSLPDIERDFAARDRLLLNADQFERIVLWFELDLYDQLQLLQILNVFASQPEWLPRISLIDHHRYLGTLEDTELANLYGTEQPVSQKQLDLARRSWQAFTANSPEPLLKTLHSDTSALPNLHAALQRLLEFYPAPNDGLNRSERQILQCLSEGIHNPIALFENTQQLEEPARFLGDSSFWRIISELADGNRPLIRCTDGQAWQEPLSFPLSQTWKSQSLELTETGQEVLAGRQDAMQCRQLDRHIGGVHLHPGHLWRWDAMEQSFTGTS